MTAEPLFPEGGLRVTSAPENDGTPAQRLRARQAARIAGGFHPLSYAGAVVLLHPDAERVPSDDRGGNRPLRCGSCRFRATVGGHAKDYPKCLYGYMETPIPAERQRRNGPTKVITMPRVTSGAASDCRSWWPACQQYEARKGDQ